MDAVGPGGGDGRTPRERHLGRRNALLAFAVALLLVGTGPYLLDRLRHPHGPSPLRILDGESIDMRSVPVNLATAAELEALPGVGPALAARLVEERSSGGPFRDVGDLQRVSGIGPVIAGKIAPYLLFDNGPATPAGR